MIQFLRSSILEKIMDEVNGEFLLVLLTVLYQGDDFVILFLVFL